MKLNLSKEFEKIKAIKPDSGFASHSRNLILSSPQHAPSPLFEPAKKTLHFFLTLSVGMAAILLMIGGVGYLKNAPLPLKMAGLDLRTLHAEAEGLKLDIALSELEYYKEAAHTGKMALNQTIEESPVYFKEVILNKETSFIEELTANDQESKTVDSALKVVSD